MKTQLMLLAFGLGLSLAGCNKTADTGAAGECSSTDDCPDGRQCIDAQCIEVQCTTSSDCPFETFCDAASYACVDGCQQNDDCLAGYSCDTVAQTCVEASCTDTQLDCPVGDLCDAGSGDCVDDTRNHCEPCDLLRGGNNQCPGGECIAFGGDDCNTDADCDPGYSCDNFGGSTGKICHADFCYMSCNENVDNSCPSGFSCGQITTDGYVGCYADCVFLTLNGYL